MLYTCTLRGLGLWHGCWRAENVRISHSCMAACMSVRVQLHLSMAGLPPCLATHFSWGAPPAAWLSWLGFWGGLGFCCSGGRPPGPPWPGAAGWGCWVVGRALGCCGPPCECCLAGWAGLSCCGWPAAFFCCCCWDRDCCLWVWPGGGLWPWGAPWPAGRVWAAPGLALAEPPSPAAACGACAGGWPWGWGRCWGGGVCWGPPREEKQLSNQVKRHPFWDPVTGCYPEAKGESAESVVLGDVRQTGETRLSAGHREKERKRQETNIRQVDERNLSEKITPGEKRLARQTDDHWGSVSS